MNKLIKLSRAIRKLDLPREAGWILKLARETDLDYWLFAKKILDLIWDEAGEGGFMPTSPFRGGILKSFRCEISLDLPSLGVREERLVIHLNIADPKIHKDDPEGTLKSKRDMAKSFKGSGELVGADFWSFKMEEGYSVGIITLYPTYSFFRKIQAMNDKEIIRAIFFHQDGMKKDNAAWTVAHEASHLLTKLRAKGTNVGRRNYGDSYIDSTEEINARVAQIIAIIYHRLGVDPTTGEGWAELLSRWNESESWERNSDFSLQVFDFVNNGKAAEFIDWILKTLNWEFRNLYLGYISDETKRRYIKRMYEVWNRLREIHSSYAPPAPVPKALADAATWKRHQITL